VHRSKGGKGRGFRVALRSCGACIRKVAGGRGVFKTEMALARHLSTVKLATAEHSSVGRITRSLYDDDAHRMGCAAAHILGSTVMSAAPPPCGMLLEHVSLV
jgi:hypothetical protein